MTVPLPLRTARSALPDSPRLVEEVRGVRFATQGSSRIWSANLYANSAPLGSLPLFVGQQIVLFAPLGNSPISPEDRRRLFAKAVLRAHFSHFLAQTRPHLACPAHKEHFLRSLGRPRGARAARQARILLPQALRRKENVNVVLQESFHGMQEQPARASVCHPSTFTKLE